MDDIETLKKENIRLTEIITAKSDIISLGAHQLRTSLSALKWILQMFADNDLGELTAEQRNYIEQALTSNERMITLVSDMLTCNHSDNAAMAPKFADVDIEKLITAIIESFKGETCKKNITLTVTQPTSPISHINADIEMIRIVIEGLIENAIKYSEKEGTVTVSITQNNDRNTLIISVHNNGIIIEEKDKPHIFEKFFRTEAVKDAQISGSGLGLFIAHNIIEQHKGTLSFESSKEAGTTFSVSLPLS